MDSPKKKRSSFLYYDWQKNRSKIIIDESIDRWVMSTAILAHEALRRQKVSLGPGKRIGA